MDWGSSPATRGGADQGRHVPGGGYAAIAQDRRFRLLKRRFHRAALIVAVSFLSWYLLYVLLSAFARGLMALPVFGNVNVAIVLGVLQFASTFLLAWWYSRHARTAVDPLAAQLREELGRQAAQERDRLVVTEPRSFAEWTPAAAAQPALAAGRYGRTAAIASSAPAAAASAASSTVPPTAWSAAPSAASPAPPPAPSPPLPRRPKRPGRAREFRWESSGWSTPDGANAWFTPAQARTGRTGGVPGTGTSGTPAHGTGTGGAW